MELFTPLTKFYEAIEDDVRISPSHISIYMALLQQWNITGGVNPISISRDPIMKNSKISARSTYNNCLHDLQEYGYIKYQPSTCGYRRSKIYLKGI